jgi:WD40 repeat protein
VEFAGQELAQFKGHYGVSKAWHSVQMVSYWQPVDGTRQHGLWNLQGQELAQFKGDFGDFGRWHSVPDGQLLATSGVDGTARSWNLQGQELAQLKGHQGGFHNVAFSLMDSCWQRVERRTHHGCGVCGATYGTAVEFAGQGISSTQRA